MGKENHSDKIVWDVLGREVLKANKPFFFLFCIFSAIGSGVLRNTERDCPVAWVGKVSHTLD